MSQHTGAPLMLLDTQHLPSFCLVFLFLFSPSLGVPIRSSRGGESQTQSCAGIAEEASRWCGCWTSLPSWAALSLKWRGGLVRETTTVVSSMLPPVFSMFKSNVPAIVVVLALVNTSEFISTVGSTVRASQWISQKTDPRINPHVLSFLFLSRSGICTVLVFHETLSTPLVANPMASMLRDICPMTFLGRASVVECSRYGEHALSSS